jgi:hypothetical protein
VRQPSTPTIVDLRPSRVRTKGNFQSESKPQSRDKLPGLDNLSELNFVWFMFLLHYRFQEFIKTECVFQRRWQAKILSVSSTKSQICLAVVVGIFACSFCCYSPENFYHPIHFLALLDRFRWCRSTFAVTFTVWKWKKLVPPYSKKNKHMNLNDQQTATARAEPRIEKRKSTNCERAYKISQRTCRNELGIGRWKLEFAVLVCWSQQHVWTSPGLNQCLISE